MQAFHLALVGATGIVGREILRVLEERALPLSEVTLLASPDSEGTRLEFDNRSHVVHQLTRKALEGVDLVIFATGAETSKDYAPYAVRAGAVVIDASSAFRLDPEVPLCVPDLNAQVLRQHRGMVAMPHSLTTQMALALAPLHRVATLKRVVVSTYQAISGQGWQAVQEFDQQLRDLLNFRPSQVHAFPHQVAFNCLPQCGDFLDNGYTEDEMALIDETRRLLDMPDLPMTVTAVRVPLAHGHSVAVTLETAQPLSADAARHIFEEAPGVEVEDDIKRLYYPLVTHANGQDVVFIGRIRPDRSVPHGLHLWMVSDNLRKGAALNAVQIVEHLMSSGTMRTQG